MDRSKRAAGIPGVDYTRRLDEYGVHFARGDRTVLDATRYDEHLPWAEGDVAVSQLDGELPRNHQEQLVGLLMRVPHELTLELHELDFVIVEPRHNLRRPVLGDEGEFLNKVDGCVRHDTSLGSLQLSPNERSTFPARTPCRRVQIRPTELVDAGIPLGPSRGSRYDRRMASARLDGILTQWNDDRGFGFITPAGGRPQIFVHISAFTRDSLRPEPGDILSFEMGSGNDGRPKAFRVQGPRGAPKPRAQSPVAGYLAIAGFLALAGVIASEWPLPLWVAALYLGLSVMCFVAYAIDKSAARRGRWRVPESTLLSIGLAGGWPGGIVAQYALRHKTRKPSFLGQFWVTVVLNVAALVAFTWYLAQAGPV